MKNNSKSRMEEKALKHGCKCQMRIQHDNTNETSHQLILSPLFFFFLSIFHTKNGRYNQLQINQYLVRTQTSQQKHPHNYTHLNKNPRNTRHSETTPRFYGSHTKSTRKDPRGLHQRNIRKKRNDNAEKTINSQERISFPNLDQQIFSERNKRDERERVENEGGG